VTPEALENILSSLGEYTKMGACFGVYGLKHYDLDIAMPRKEQATGRGHRDFTVFVDPFLGTQKAAQRRDFTINAFMEDVLTGEIIDHFSGQEDLRQGIVRHVDDTSFMEDPLRVLRAAQFAARFGFSVAEETVALCARMDLSALAGERVLGELEKALSKSPHPSTFFETLRQMGQLDCWFAEIEALIGIPQDPRFHPEGDVWNHTMLVVDQAAKLQDQAKEPIAFLLSALCHDLGKQNALQNDNGRIRALGHEKEGIPLTEAFLSRITHERKLRKYVVNMVELHMRPNQLVAQRSSQKAFCHLFDKSVCPEDLILLAKADALGRSIEQDYRPTELCLQEKYLRYREIIAKPSVQGADLIAAGFKPGKAFRFALSYARKLHLAGVEKESALRQTIAYLQEKQEDIEASEED
ncbi:MAG: HD domain-containing protein, partial [Christensenellaceae bacterium]